MSCMESKMALRVEIESLKGNTYDDAYGFFKAFLGEADEPVFYIMRNVGESTIY